MLKFDRFCEGEHFKVEDRGYDSPCYIWIKGLSDYGYARTTICYGSLHQMKLVHRYLYELKYGILSKNRDLDHKCVQRDCIRTEHMQPVTHQLNCQLAFTRNNREVSGIGKQNKEKTHCHRGHEFTFENTYNKPSGRRVCKHCRSIEKLTKKR